MKNHDWTTEDGAACSAAASTPAELRKIAEDTRKRAARLLKTVDRCVVEANRWEQEIAEHEELRKKESLEKRRATIAHNRDPFGIKRDRKLLG